MLALIHRISPYIQSTGYIMAQAILNVNTFFIFFWLSCHFFDLRATCASPLDRNRPIQQHSSMCAIRLFQAFGQQRKQQPQTSYALLMPHK
jgi:hypothetical protein